MAWQARNPNQIKELLMPRLEVVVKYVMEKILESNREAVQRVVYDAYNPTDYNRTMEFKEAWETEVDVQSASNKVRGEFRYAPDKLTPGSNDPYSDDYGQHVSVIDGFLMTDGLAEVIYEGLAGDIFGQGPWTRKRDAWTELWKIAGSRNLKQWIKEGCDKAGLPVHSHNRPLGKF